VCSSDLTIYTIDLSEFIYDADGISDIVNVSLSEDKNSFLGVFLESEYLKLTFFAPANYKGTDFFLLTIRDSYGETDQQAITVKVVNKFIEGAVTVLTTGGAETNKHLSWKTKVESKDFVEFDIVDENSNDNIYSVQTIKESEYTEVHSQVLYNLKPQTTYRYRIASEVNGAISYSTVDTFSTGNAAEEIIVYPIPYETSEENSYLQKAITFTNIPTNGQVLIYNLLGEPVYKAKDVINAPFYWAVENNSGKKVSSGLYIYVIKDAKNKKVQSGK